jgi:NAD(P)-dependent dehydrogenase (short-subunit alcohol dehydrogenase family)
VIGTAADLRGKRALITGSTQGIGRAIARGFASAGAKVFLHGLASAPVVEAEMGPGFAGFLANDLGKPGSAESLDAAARHAMGGIDILVLCASVEIREGHADLSSAATQAQLDVNIAASLRLLTLAVPPMEAQGWGRVIAIGSVQEIHPNADAIVYVATKAAQTAMMRTLARNASRTGVTFNTLRPGAIETDRNAAKLADPAFRANIVARIPAGRLGMPEDCVGIAVALCGEACAYINGAEIPVDGGLGL